MDRTITDREFRQFQKLIEEESGIHLSDAKRALLVGRLNRRMRQLGMHSFSSYYERIVSGEDDELTLMLDAISTNETHFFREAKHFDFLENVVVPRWRQELDEGRMKPFLRVWSAACSTGEEPYSIGMCLRSALPAGEGWQVEIVASDISTRVLRTAQEGLYPIEKATEIPRHYLKAYMRRGVRSREGWMAVSHEIASTVRFARVNLHCDPLPMNGRFDLIFCRNVLIYFRPDEKKRVISRLLQHLESRGYLFLGHAESVAGDTRLAPAGPTIYRLREQPATRERIA